MATKQTRPIIISNSEGGQTTGTLHYVAYTQKELMGRAWKALGLFWGLAIITVFIPLAHFFLVPGFLIAGPVVAYSRYRAKDVMESASGQCPTCHEESIILLEASDQLPKWTYCSANNDPVQLADA